MEVDPVGSAIKDFERLHRLVGGWPELGKGFRSRARSVPSMVEDIGLVPALSFCFASATRSTYEAVKKSFEGEGSLEGVKKEEGSYALYLLLVLSYLRRLGFVSEEDLGSPAAALRKLVDVQALASRLLRPYCVEIKRLSEAVFEAE